MCKSRGLQKLRQRLPAHRLQQVHSNAALGCQVQDWSPFCTNFILRKSPVCTAVKLYSVTSVVLAKQAPNLLQIVRRLFSGKSEEKVTLVCRLYSFEPIVASCVCQTLFPRECAIQVSVFQCICYSKGHATITQTHANEAMCEWRKPRLITPVYPQFVFQDFCSTVDKLFFCGVTSTRTSISRRFSVLKTDIHMSPDKLGLSNHFGVAEWRLILNAQGHIHVQHVKYRLSWLGKCVCVCVRVCVCDVAGPRRKASQPCMIPHRHMDTARYKGNLQAYTQNAKLWI